VVAAKRKNSIYRPGKRTSDWLKIKARLQQEFVVLKAIRVLDPDGKGSVPIIAMTAFATRAALARLVS
jgi:ATP-dependent DNA ligase